MPDDVNLVQNEPVWSHSCQYCGAEFVTDQAKSNHESSCSDNPKNKKDR